MSQASTLQNQNRTMLQDAVALRKLNDAQVRVLLMRALDNMTTYEMADMVQQALNLSLDSFEVEMLMK